MTVAVQSIHTNPIHLGLGGKAIPQPPFTGIEWYESYVGRHAGDGAEGRLVSFSRFTEDWNSWEMHPAGEEVVLCLSGSMTVQQEDADGAVTPIILNPGDYAVNPPGVWHTADIAEEATALFITVGVGTEHRPR